jgi:hypothetical protein
MEIAMFWPIAAVKFSSRLLDSHWAMLKSICRKLPTGKCPKVIAEFLNAIKRTLRNPQI